MSRKVLTAAVLMQIALPALADEKVNVCFNYGCLAQAEVVYSEAQLAQIAGLLGVALDAGEERAAIGVAIGRLLGWAGEQTPIAADRGGNYADAAVFGKMDCIDHSTTTTRLLEMLERRRLLRHHRVLAPEVRQRFWVMVHYSALIEALGAAATTGEGAQEAPAAPTERYAVDSWFYDNGRPAVVMPLALWQSGESPDDAQ